MAEKVCSERHARLNASSTIEAPWETKDLHHKTTFWSLKFVYLCILTTGHEICSNILSLNSRLFRIHLACEAETFMLRGRYLLIHTMPVKLDMSKYLRPCLSIWDDATIEPAQEFKRNGINHGVTFVKWGQLISTCSWSNYTFWGGFSAKNLSTEVRQTPMTLANPTRALAATSDLMPAPRKTAVEKKTTVLIPESCWIKNKLAPVLTTAIGYSTQLRTDSSLLSYHNLATWEGTIESINKPANLHSCFQVRQGNQIQIMVNYWSKQRIKQYPSNNACLEAPPRWHLHRKFQNRQSWDSLFPPQTYLFSPTIALIQLLLQHTSLAE